MQIRFSYALPILFCLNISLLILSSSSCTKNRCEEPLDVNESKIIVGFKDVAGDYIHTESTPKYNKDSLMVFDEKGNKYFLSRQLDVIPNTALRYWKFDFGPIYNGQLDIDAFNKEVCKKYILKYNYNETDTIVTCFKAFKTKCGSEFSSFKIFHQGVLLNEVSNTIFSNITITKK